MALLHTTFINFFPAPHLLQVRAEQEAKKREGGATGESDEEGEGKPVLAKAVQLQAQQVCTGRTGAVLGMRRDGGHRDVGAWRALMCRLVLCPCSTLVPCE